MDEFLLKLDICSRLPYEQKCYGKHTDNIFTIVPYDNKEGQVDLRYALTESLNPILFPISCMISEIKVKGRVLTPLTELAKIEGCLSYDIVLEEIKNIYGNKGFRAKDENRICFEYYIEDMAFHKYAEDGLENDSVYESLSMYDWMNEYMIDYRGLINRGLAISVFDLKDNPYA